MHLHSILIEGDVQAVRWQGGWEGGICHSAFGLLDFVQHELTPDLVDHDPYCPQQQS